MSTIATAPGTGHMLLEVPLVHYSVKWWRPLHQGETVAVMAARVARLPPAIAAAVAANIELSMNSRRVCRVIRESPWFDAGKRAC
jgi:hypothetical protein